MIHRLLLPTIVMLTASEANSAFSQAQGTVKLSDAQVAAFADLAMKGIEIEYPNKPSNVMSSEKDVLSPKEMHPVF